MPELLVIFFLYFGGSYLLGLVLAPFGVAGFVEVSGFWSAVLALALVQGAYASEVFRGAILAVPAGLHEAAAALGLKPLFVLRHITAPIALRYAFPGLANLWMVIVKNTPLVSVVGLEDFIRAAGTAGQNTKEYLFFFGLVIAVYLVAFGRLDGGAGADRDAGSPRNLSFGACPMIMDLETALAYLPGLLRGALVTLELTVATIVIGLLIAVPVALCRNARNAPLRWFAIVFVFFFRGAPLLALLYMIYYGLPELPGLKESWAWTLALAAVPLRRAGAVAELGRLSGGNPRRRHAPRAARRDRGGDGRRLRPPRRSCATCSRRTRRGSRCAPTATRSSSSSRARRWRASSPCASCSPTPTRSISTPSIRSRPYLAAGALYLALVFIVLRAVGFAERMLSPELRVGSSSAADAAGMPRP